MILSSVERVGLRRWNTHAVRHTNAPGGQGVRCQVAWGWRRQVHLVLSDLLSERDGFTVCRRLVDREHDLERRSTCRGWD